MSDVTVTIGLCVRNSEATVRRALSGILSQDFPMKLVELVVVDGNSRDATVAIVRQVLGGSRLRYEVLHETVGLGYARQLVVDKASGEFIVWVDGDMELPPSFIRNQVEFMQKNPRLGIGKGKYDLGRTNTLVADLENIEFVVNFQTTGDAGSKALGTSGCIYRVEAVRQVGGFGLDIKGVGEDMDIENKIRLAGWELHVTHASFFEIRRSTWKSLWKEYFWHGCGGSYLFMKDRRMIEYYKIFPLIAVLEELSRVSIAYRLLNKKRVFLLPVHYVFKRTAWVLGFISNYIGSR